jgi:hypothetical protein
MQRPTPVPIFAIVERVFVLRLGRKILRCLLAIRRNGFDRRVSQSIAKSVTTVVGIPARRDVSVTS